MYIAGNNIKESILILESEIEKLNNFLKNKNLIFISTDTSTSYVSFEETDVLNKICEEEDISTEDFDESSSCILNKDKSSEEISKTIHPLKIYRFWKMN